MKSLLNFIRREGVILFIIKCSDYILRPLGISFFSYTKFKKHNFFMRKRISFKKQNNFNVFENIYNNNYWKINYSKSGAGSEIDQYNFYITSLRNLLIKLKINTFLDVPCGDMSWMPHVIKDLNIKYIGGDIVKDLIKKNKIKFPNFNFCYFDLTRSEFPKVPLIHIRDCLFHFSFLDIQKVIKNLKQSIIKYVLLTSHKSFMLKNFNIETGDFRYLDLEKKPFFFPKPKIRLKDYRLGQFPRYVNLWSIKELPSHIL